MNKEENMKKECSNCDLEYFCDHKYPVTEDGTPVEECTEWRPDIWAKEELEKESAGDDFICETCMIHK